MLNKPIFGINISGSLLFANYSIFKKQINSLFCTFEVRGWEGEGGQCQGFEKLAGVGEGAG